MTASLCSRVVFAQVGWMLYYQSATEAARISRGGAWDDKQPTVFH